MGIFTNELEEKGRRKHKLRYETRVTISEDFLLMLQAAVEKSNGALNATVKKRNSGGTLEVDFEYSVRGANKTDVTTFLTRAGIPVVHVEPGKTDLTCSCPSKGGNCTDESV